MADDMSFRQRTVIEFLVKEEIPAAEIHQRLQRAYGSVCMGVSSVQRWVKHFKDGNTSIEDEPWSGRPRIASTEHSKERVDEIIQDDRRVTVDTIARKLGIGHSAVQEMIESLGYRKVCARWVQWLLTEDHKGQQKAVTSELLQRYGHEGDDFLFCIVTGDKSWFHHFEPETKWQSMEWHHLHSPSKKEAKTVPSAAKVMGTVFWDAERFILAEFLEPGQTTNAAGYVQTLHNFCHALCDKRLGRNIIILHDNARPHAARLTLEAIAKMGWEVLPHPSHSPDLVPSNYHLFRFVKDQLRGRFETREAIQKQCVGVFGRLERNFTKAEFSNSQNAGRNVYKEVGIMWKNKERSVN
ncbi:hypothetical protein B7P43_G13308 [Cryptotermes secundus]|uniref:Mos1 transposase HTH domain-containing protein n=1 Tax=Cryptotermes secundus TaxID=105785 RepID=A0A2J7PNT5_9NEOP|nr:hypothetical protein B7P43_G13308 [Cryptotermes secundus]